MRIKTISGILFASTIAFAAVSVLMSMQPKAFATSQQYQTCINAAMSAYNRAVQAAIVDLSNSLTAQKGSIELRAANTAFASALVGCNSFLI